MQNETNIKTIKHRIRKRIIFLGLCLGLAVNQIMIFQANKAIAQSIEVNPYAQEAVQKQINPLEIINRVDKQYAQNQQKNTNYTPLSQQNSHAIEINNTQNSQNIQTVQPIQNSAVYYPQQNIYPNYYGNQNTTYQTGITKYNPDRPEWIEFCQYGLENAKEDDSFHFWCTNSRYKAEDQNYWVERRKDFEKHLAYCDKIQDSIAQSGCYQKLRLRQNRISANYVDPWTKAAIWQEKLQRGLGALMMYDAVKNPNIRVNHSGTVTRNINLFHY